MILEALRCCVMALQLHFLLSLCQRARSSSDPIVILVDRKDPGKCYEVAQTDQGENIVSQFSLELIQCHTNTSLKPN